MLKATHLTMMRSEIYDRHWERFQIRRPARLIAVKPCLTGVSMRSCQVLDISRGGAAFTLASTAGLPNHYYLSILDVSARIGCAEVYRQGERIGVKFIAPLDEDTLRDIIRHDFAHAAS